MLAARPSPGPEPVISASRQEPARDIIRWAKVPGYGAPQDPLDRTAAWLSRAGLADSCSPPVLVPSTVDILWSPLVDLPLAVRLEACTTA